MMHQADPKACFAFEFWDGEVICFGDIPRAILRMKTRRCAHNIIRKGFLGFGESYMKYVKTVPRWIPRLSTHKDDSSKT